jgi:hypothetical protein
VRRAARATGTGSEWTDDVATFVWATTGATGSTREAARTNHKAAADDRMRALLVFMSQFETDDAHRRDQAPVA